ncbi:hypothetical protein ACOJBO_09085 [Rhizobium beringeri]
MRYKAIKGRATKILAEKSLRKQLLDGRSSAEALIPQIDQLPIV